MARTNKTAGEETQTAKKKLPLLLRILLALLALAFVLGAVVACLGLDLLGRISRPAEDGFALLSLDIDVPDSEQLRTVMRRLEQISGVMRVTRPAG